MIVTRVIMRMSLHLEVVEESVSLVLYPGCIVGLTNISFVFALCR